VRRQGDGEDTQVLDGGEVVGDDSRGMDGRFEISYS